jgi:hypothetical protein
VFYAENPATKGDKRAQKMSVSKGEKHESKGWKKGKNGAVSVTKDRFLRLRFPYIEKKPQAT